MTCAYNKIRTTMVTVMRSGCYISACSGLQLLSALPRKGSGSQDSSDETIEQSLQLCITTSVLQS